MACKIGAPYHHQLFFFFFLFLLSLSLSLSHISSALLTSAQETTLLPVPVPVPVDGGSMRPVMKTEIRRRLGSFKICALCTCCGGPKRVCVPSPCCYAINCNIPNRPFGVCSFTPKACNCFGCHL